MAKTGTATPANDVVLGAALALGTANVIMQLARPAVGYGVVESRVESGQLFRHPVKRTRTTLTYVALAVKGGDEERRLFARGVNKVHARVRSGPDAPVAYNALDPELQLWVAACLYRGVEDAQRFFRGVQDEAEAERIYAAAATMGTMLQVPARMWPADRAAFEEYWADALAHVSIDDTVRGYLTDVTDLRFAPWPVPQLFGPLNRFLTTGFLPPLFRDQMRFAWSPARQRRFDLLVAALRPLVAALPPIVREFPFNAYLWDMRRRIRRHGPLV